MNINTKQITAIAVISLFAYTANAQTATYGAQNFTIQPAGAAGPDLLVINTADAAAGTVVEGQGDTPNLVTYTTTNYVGTVSGNNTISTLGNGGNSVNIQNDGINLAEVTSRTDVTEMDFYSSTVVTFNTDTLTVVSEDFTAYTVAKDAGADGTTLSIFADTSEANAVNGLSNFLTASPANLGIFGDAVVTGTESTSGGNMNVEGFLNLGDIGNVETAIAGNAQAVTDLAGGAVAANAQAVTDLAGGAVAANAQAVTDLAGGAVAANAQAVTDLATGAVQANSNAIAEMTDGLEEGETGIVGTITKKANGDIHIGENSLITNESTVNGVTTQSLFAEDAGGNAIDINITSGSDLRINGDLVATEFYADQGDAFVTAAFQAADTNLQSQIDNNREDIDRNARGIAMVAALQHTTVLPGMTQALDLSAAIFEGETGLALNYARRINENVQINFGAASTSDFDESVIKAGIGVQW